MSSLVNFERLSYDLQGPAQKTEPSAEDLFVFSLKRITGYIVYDVQKYIVVLCKADEYKRGEANTQNTH